MSHNKKIVIDDEGRLHIERAGVLVMAVCPRKSELHQTCDHFCPGLSAPYKRAIVSSDKISRSPEDNTNPDCIDTCFGTLCGVIEDKRK